MPMNRTDINNVLEPLQTDIEKIEDTSTQKVLGGLLNLIEQLSTENEELKEENQTLKDENNRLKGEQGKPDIKGKNNKSNSSNISSEEERNNPNSKDNSDQEDEDIPSKKRKRERSSKLSRISIDREEICPVNRSELPTDAIFKDYDDVVIQDIKIETDNVKYRREVYYSPSEKKSYRGKLPEGVEGRGEYGIGIRSLIPLFKSECNMTEPCLLDFFENFGIIISKTYISTQWTTGYLNFHDEKDAIVQAGLASTIYQQMDDTGARVNGENYYTHILCNPYYSAFFTRPRKDRLTILKILNHNASLMYLYNETTQQFLKGEFELSERLCQALDNHFKGQKLCNEREFEGHLDQIREAKIGPTIRKRIKESFAMAAYWQQNDIPVIKILMSDDAPQFKKITKEQILCWIHDGRHYKKLSPFVKQHQDELDAFLEKYWDFYHQLKDYKESPSFIAFFVLNKEFDDLFTSQTDYEYLNERIKKTFAKKKELLLVLKYPELPLHNNASELAARVQVRHRDVSFQTKSEAGTKIKDTFMTLSETAKKLGVRAYDYIHDRVSGRYKLPSLATIIENKSQIKRNLVSGIP
jgi:hypothetical protein